MTLLDQLWDILKNRYMEENIFEGHNESFFNIFKKSF